MKYKPKHKLRSDPKESKNLILRLKKIEGQIRGIQGMIENEKYCDEVLNQISSVKSALDGVSRGLLKSHIRTCVTERIRGNDSKILEEFIRTIGYVLR